MNEDKLCKVQNKKDNIKLNTYCFIAALETFDVPWHLKEVVREELFKTLTRDFFGFLCNACVNKIPLAIWKL